MSFMRCANEQMPIRTIPVRILAHTQSILCEMGQSAKRTPSFPSLSPPAFNCHRFGAAGRLPNYVIECLAHQINVPPDEL